MQAYHKIRIIIGFKPITEHSKLKQIQNKILNFNWKPLHQATDESIIFLQIS